MDDVVREVEREMLLHARRFQLCAYLSGKDVVAYKILLSIVLVETAALAVVDKVVLYADAR